MQNHAHKENIIKRKCFFFVIKLFPTLYNGVVVFHVTIVASELHGGNEEMLTYSKRLSSTHCKSYYEINGYEIKPFSAQNVRF